MTEVDLQQRTPGRTPSVVERRKSGLSYARAITLCMSIYPEQLGVATARRIGNLSFPLAWPDQIVAMDPPLPPPRVPRPSPIHRFRILLEGPCRPALRFRTLMDGPVHGSNSEAETELCLVSKGLRGWFLWMFKIVTSLHIPGARTALVEIGPPEV